MLTASQLLKLKLKTFFILKLKRPSYCPNNTRNHNGTDNMHY